MNFDLRDYQKSAIADLRRSLGSGSRSPLAVLPTGAGKTLIAAAIVRSALEKGKRVLFLAPRRILVHQASAKLLAAGIGHGVIMAGEVATTYAPVQVASVPTLYSRAVKRQRMPLPMADVVLVDEAHLSIAAMPKAVLAAFPDAVKVGLTATPSRSDGAGLGEIYDDLVMGPNVAELTAQGYLVPARYFAPTKPDLDGVRVQMGDYNQRQLGERMDKAPLIGDVVANWSRIGEDRPTVVFAVNVAHSMHLRDRFLEVGVHAEHIDADTSGEEREAILSRVRSGETRVICNCEVLSLGWDEPCISCAVLAKPTKSITRYLQQVGRVLRPHAGKSNALIVDHTGVVDDLGFVDEVFDWSLDGDGTVSERTAKVREKEAKKITCGDCGEVFMGGRICPGCGHEAPAHYAKPHETVDADLVEMDKAKRRKNREWSSDDKHRFYGELKYIAVSRGYNSHWADHKYREKLSVWPNAYKHAPAIPPSRETLAWVKSRQIAYAKRKRAA